nr:hypothetical protein ELOWGMBK_ELOWGMBK_CDS_0041 [Herelleviridae sp.]
MCVCKYNTSFHQFFNLFYLVINKSLANLHKLCCLFRPYY